MLTLILDEILVIRSAMAALDMPLHPGGGAPGTPLDDCARITSFDPKLAADCRAVLQGRAVAPVLLRGAEGAFQRHVAPVQGDAAARLMVCYIPCPGPSSGPSPLPDPAALIEAFPGPAALLDADNRLQLCNSAYAGLHEAAEASAAAARGDERPQSLAGAAQPPDAAGNAEGQPADGRGQAGADLCDASARHEVRDRDGRYYRLSERALWDGTRLRTLTEFTELRRLEARLGDVVKGARAGTWSLDLRTGEGEINDRWAEMLGHEPDALRPVSYDNWRRLVHPLDLPEAEARFELCLSGAVEEFDLEYRLRHRDGSWRWFQSRGGVTLRDAVGQPVEVAGVHFDITARKTLETEMLARAAAFDATEDGIAILTPSGRFAYVNPAQARMFGEADPTVLVGRPWRSYYRCKDAAALLKTCIGALLRTGSWRGETLARRADGTIFEQELSLTRTASRQVVCVTRDITARKQVEHQRLDLRERIEIAQRQQALNLMVAGLSHDMGNLIGLISQIAESATDHPEVDAQALRADMAAIRAAARQAIDLVAPIRDLGRRKPVRRVLDLRSVVREVAELLRLGAPPGLQILTALPAGPVKTCTDATQIIQVLLNLGLNARDAVGRGPQRILLGLDVWPVPLGSAAIEVGSLPRGRAAVLRVSDTGCGISAAARLRLWEPHFTTKAERGGNGLGLPVVAEIVRSIGGAIALESAPGRGTSFAVLWPLDEPDDEDHEPEERSMRKVSQQRSKGAMVK